jgi:hypothetical protein
VADAPAGVRELELRHKARAKNPEWGISLEDPGSVLRSRGPSMDPIRGVEPDEAL